MAETTTTVISPDNSTTTTTVAPKPGWQTTEFWLTTATALTAILNKAFGWNIPAETVATVAGIVASYVIGRSLVKK